MNTLLILFKAKQLLLSLLIVLNHDNPDYCVRSFTDRGVCLTVLVWRSSEIKGTAPIYWMADNFSNVDIPYEIRGRKPRFQAVVENAVHEKIALTDAGEKILTAYMQSLGGPTYIQVLKAQKTIRYNGDLLKYFKLDKPGVYRLELDFELGTIIPLDTELFSVIVNNIEFKITDNSAR